MKKTTAPDSPSPRRRRRRSERLLLLTAALLLLTAAVLLLADAALGMYADTRKEEQPAPIKSGLSSLVQSTEAAQLAKAVKADYLALADAVKGQDFPAARSHRAAVDRDIQSLEEYLDSPVVKAAAGVASLHDELAAAGEYLDIAKTANLELIDPLLDYAERHPVDELKAEGGIRVEALLGYLDLAGRLYPAAEDVFARLDAADPRLLSLLDKDGSLSASLSAAGQLAKELLPMMDQLPLLRAMLGAEGDRVYLFAAQNTAEVRASGGFPGSIGKLRIQNGVLTLDQFKSCYDVLRSGTPYAAGITQREDELFAGRMRLAWDSDFCPDFERVAQIWALSYEARSGEHVNGVISATPVIIQRLLGFLGSITIDDGTVLDGDNAMRVLGHDLYFRYYPAGSGWGASDYMNELFSETASSTLSLLISTAGIGHLKDYLSFARESFADRTLLLWMDDPAEQELVRQLGWAGTLNHDAAKPKIGVFYNSTSASKMGWFLDLDAAIGEPRENADGSKTYPVVVTFGNALTAEEKRQAGSFILGGSWGGLTGTMFIFAPEGGTITNAVSSSGRLQYSEYEGLQLVYQNGTIPMDSTVIVSCEITTSPLAEEPLGLMRTPTAQDYR